MGLKTSSHQSKWVVKMELFLANFYVFKRKLNQSYWCLISFLIHHQVILAPWTEMPCRWPIIIHVSKLVQITKNSIFLHFLNLLFREVFEFKISQMLSIPLILVYIQNLMCSSLNWDSTQWDWSPKSIDMYTSWRA